MRLLKNLDQRTHRTLSAYDGKEPEGHKTNEKEQPATLSPPRVPEYLPITALSLSHCIYVSGLCISWKVLEGRDQDMAIPSELSIVLAHSRAPLVSVLVLIT